LSKKRIIGKSCIYEKRVSCFFSLFFLVAAPTEIVKHNPNLLALIVLLYLRGRSCIAGTFLCRNYEGRKTVALAEKEKGLF
jgi:hypothetical protein